MKDGMEYELFVKEIYERLLKAESVENVLVKHDILLKGTTGVEHQIDLYWEFFQAKIKHRVVIECKDYNSNVTKEKIMGFHDKIIDIGGVQGVYVTKTGYQSGAKEVADKYGITLIEMRKPNEKDWEGKMKEINIELQIYCPEAYDFVINIDKKWFNKQNEEIKTTIARKKRFHNTKTTFLIEKEKKKKKSLMEIINNLPWKKEEQVYEKVGDDLFLFFEEGEIEYKISDIKFKYKYNIGKQEIKIDGEKTIKAIIKNAITGEIDTMPYMEY